MIQNKKRIFPRQISKYVSGEYEKFSDMVRKSEKPQSHFSGAGFTLIEILTVLAIIGVMAAVVLVSMSSYGSKARSAKVQSILSSAIPAMISCWGNTNNSGSLASVNAPTVPGGGNNICSLGASYGAWPALSGDLNNYRYIAADIDINNTVGRRSSRWAFSVQSNSSYDDIKVCCNSTMNGCKVSAAGTACAYNNPTN